MADYTQNTTFATKDSLLTGDPEKIILGADFDGEFSEIAARSADKEDTANKGAASGYASLDGSSLILAAELPAATSSAIGALEIATTAEAQALTLDTKTITPSGLSDVLGGNDAVLTDLQALTSQAADSIYGWDLSATTAIGFAPTEGIQTSTTNLLLDFTGLSAATPVGADTMAFYDATDSTHKKATLAAVEAVLEPANMTNGYDMGSITLTAGEGLSYSAGGTDLSANATIDFDISSLTTMEGNALAAGDLVYVDDGGAGTGKAIAIEDMGLRVQTAQATQTLAAADMNSIMEFTATATLTLPLNATTALPIGTPIVLNMKHATQVLTVTAAASVTLVTINHPAGAAAASDTVQAGGSAILFKTAADVWVMSGDISD